MVAEKLSKAQPLDQSALRAILKSSSADTRLSPSGSRISQDGLELRWRHSTLLLNGS
ncbi:Hypothetical protein FKW44_002752, partial [Caligus rogercresseyi]